VDTTGVHEPRHFFSLANELAEAEERALTLRPEETHECLRAALLDTVRHHLIADVPVGVFLSSGLDSTALAALATEIGGSLRTVTLGFEEYQGTENDEVPLAEFIAQCYGTSHQTKWVRKQDFQDELPGLLEAMDQPTIDGVNSYFVSRATAETGLKVALSGLGGDELFAGYSSFWQIPRLVRALRPLLPVPVLGKAFRYVSASILKHLTSPKYAGLLEYGGDYGGPYLLRRGLFMPWELPEVLDPDMVREGWQTLQPLARLDETIDGIRNNRLTISALEMSWYMRNQLLRDADWASMAHSLEIRVPLVDVMLFRAVLPLITSSQPIDKRDVARVSVQSLPDELLQRRKTGFFLCLCMSGWLKSTGQQGLKIEVCELDGFYLSPFR
jgi:asparagine synthase (glutamine-hydrolysing)